MGWKIEDQHSVCGAHPHVKVEMNKWINCRLPKLGYRHLVSIDSSSGVVNVGCYVLGDIITGCFLTNALCNELQK